MVTITFQYHCQNKVRLNDQHDYVNTSKRFVRGDGGNTQRAYITKRLCSHCKGEMVAGDPTKLGGKR